MEKNKININFLKEKGYNYEKYIDKGSYSDIHLVTSIINISTGGTIEKNEKNKKNIKSKKAVYYALKVILKSKIELESKE